MRKKDLELRIINFSVDVINSSKNLNTSIASENLKKQLIRSSSSVALNYGEVQDAGLEKILFIKWE